MSGPTEREAMLADIKALREALEAVQSADRLNVSEWNKAMKFVDAALQHTARWEEA